MRRRKSLLKDIFDVAALLPWWVSLGLAIASWILLGAYAGREIVTDPSAPLAAAPQAVWRGLAQVGQFVLPAALLAGMVANLYKRRRAGGLLDRLDRDGAMDALAVTSWQDFELLVGELFRRRGYSVVETPTGADGGVDLVARRGAERVFVQCKHWRSRDVGVAVVRELYGVVTAKKASGGAVVTGGRFTAEAVNFARQVNIELVDGAMLRAESRGAQSAASSAREVAAVPNAPSCPTCQSKMVKRTARRGAQAGKVFWGCVRYPACRGTREVA